MIIINAMIQLGFTGKGFFILIAMAITLAMAYTSTMTVGRLSLKKKESY